MAVSTYFNRVKYTPVSAGTVDFVTSAAVTGFLTPATAGITNGAIVSYVAFNSTQTEWETGQGTYTSGTTTLARTTVRESSNAGAKVNFTAAPTVALDLQAQDIITFAPLISPSFTTPALGVATATSLAIGGATIGANALAVTGTAAFSGTVFANEIQNTAGTNAGNVNIGPSSASFKTRLGGNGSFSSVAVNDSGLTLRQGLGLQWGTSTTDPAPGTYDTVLSRQSAGVQQFGTNAVNAAGSWLATSAGLGPTPAISASTMFNFSAGTTAISQMRFGASTAPTSPVDGDFWFDGTNVKIRVSGATKTFTLI